MATEETLAERVDRLLGGHRGGRAEMCQKLGIHPNTIGNWKKKGYAPSVDTMAKVADYLHVSIEYLWTGTHAKEVSTPEDEIFLQKYLALSNKDKKGVRILVNGLSDLGKEKA